MSDGKGARLGEARIPALGLGTWTLRGREGARTVRTALEIGYRHVDTAQGYGNESDVGDGIRAAGLPREQVFVTTKLGWDALPRDRVEPAVKASLRRLRTDWVDLLLIHWPHPHVPLEETLEAMLEVRDAGLVRHLGVSNFPSSQMERAAKIAPIACEQVEYHPFLSQSVLLEALRRQGIPLVAYSPLARGSVQRSPEIRRIASECGATPAAVALAWLLSQENVGAVPKASSEPHLRENLGAAMLRLSPEQHAEIASLARGERHIDPDFAPEWDE